MIVVDSLFIAILNMSITGVYVIVAILLARLLLKKSPKVISYCLWMVVGIRLIFPFSIDSVWSLVPFGVQPIAVLMSDMFSREANASLVSTVITTGGLIWIIGATAMFAYGISSYTILKRNLQKSIHKQGNIFEGVNIATPHVLGFIYPKIYLPLELSDEERKYVILHEQIHIRRFDHFVKFIAYSILCLHWFNPLVWLAFSLMCRDMEMSCDEHVLKKMGVEETKEGYSMALVALAIEKKFITNSPLAFGGSDVKARVENVLNFKNISKLAISVKIILAIVFSAGLMTNTVIATDLQEDCIWPIYPTFSCCEASIWH